MALTKTPICDFGKKAEDFKLQSINNKSVSLEEIKGKNGTLIMFICNHCPYVKAIIKDLVEDCKDLKNDGINSVAIMSNDTKKYPEDSFDKMIEFAKNSEDISVNLKDQIIISDNSIFKFNIDSFRKHCLLNGLDDIGITMEKSNLIDNYEKKINNKSWNIPDTQNTNL